jgi:hypothetical protein
LVIVIINIISTYNFCILETRLLTAAFTSALLQVQITLNCFSCNFCRKNWRRKNQINTMYMYIYILFVYICIAVEDYQEPQGWDPTNWFNPATLLSLSQEFQCHMSWSVFMLGGLRWQVVVRFVDIGDMFKLFSWCKIEWSSHVRRLSMHFCYLHLLFIEGPK